MSHYHNIYYETREQIREINFEEEFTEDYTEDYTYTDMEHLETIQEISEVCDLTENTDTTETEFIEEIEDLPTYNLNDVDIPTFVSNNVEEEIETTPDIEERCPTAKFLDENHEDSIISNEAVELESPYSEQTEDIEVYEEFPTFDVTDVDILDVISKDINEPTDKATKTTTIFSEDGRFDTIPSLQCHFMTSLDFESEKLPSCVAHRVYNDVTEESDSISMVSHSQHVFFLKNYPMTGEEYNEAESATKLTVKRTNKKFAKEDIEKENEVKYECQESEILENCMTNHQSAAEVTQEESVVEIDVHEESLKEEREELLTDPSESVLPSYQDSPTTQTEIVNIVKGIEFKTEIQINQLEEEELHIQETQCKDITSKGDSVTADTSTHLLHVNEEVTDTITPEENTEYQADFYTSMLSHQQPNMGLFEDFTEVQFTGSMLCHLNKMPSEETDFSSLVSHSVIARDMKNEEEEECSMLPLEEQISCEEEKSASDGGHESYEIQSPTDYSERETGHENFESKSATESSEKDGAIQSYKLQLRIKELQKLVEDELEEFDTKRKVKSNLIKATATETEIVNIVKGIEFKSEIKMNQLEEEEEDLDKTEDDIDSIVEIDNMDYGEEVKYQLKNTHETIEEEEVDHIIKNTSDTVEEEKLDETNQNNFDEEYKSLNPVRNVVQTETDIVNTVKGIEFKTEIKINQLEEEEEDLDRTEDDIDSIVEIDNIDYGEEIKDQIETTQRIMEMEELEETNQNNFDEEDKQL